jgi:hypothetical protein
VAAICCSPTVTRSCATARFRTGIWLSPISRSIVGLAFFFRNSLLDRTVAFYPGPAGATESELGLDAWGAIAAAEPRVGLLADDVEALLVRVPSDADGGGQTECYLVPIDACYEFVGGLRTRWRGFDGGQEAREFIDDFFGTLADSSEERR